jgi:hypothetical protein
VREERREGRKEEGRKGGREGGIADARGHLSNLSIQATQSILHEQ